MSAVLWLVAGVAEALQAIHGAGIVHRDLKPSNVLLAADGPRVIDFGISLASDFTSHTATGSAVGTPSFMAPEQASGGEVTAATDIFALGQTAAFAALGRPLYGDGSAVGVLYRIVHDEPDLSLLPPQLRSLIARCLAADPEDLATPAEVVEWCRQRLGRDADAGAGPAVWREVMGPEVTVPAPVPDPTPVHTLPFVTRPQPAGALLLTGLTWTVKDAGDRFRDWVAGTPATSDPSADASSSSSSASGASGDRTPEASQPTSTAPEEPTAVPYPLQLLNEQNSLSIKDPRQPREDRKGDIRFACEGTSCALESDTSVIAMLYGEPGATLGTCRSAVTGRNADRRLPLAAAAAGSEICIKHNSGDIALFVIQVKSTAMPNIGFVTGDLTVWRAAQEF